MSPEVLRGELYVENVGALRVCGVQKSEGIKLKHFPGESEFQNDLCAKTIRTEMTVAESE